MFSDKECIYVFDIRYYDYRWYDEFTEDGYMFVTGGLKKLKHKTYSLLCFSNCLLTSILEIKLILSPSTLLKSFLDYLSLYPEKQP